MTETDKTERLTFEEFFDTNFDEATRFGFPKPREELIKELKEDFEIFVNDTKMGSNFALQLKEAKDGNEERIGIGKIKLTEFTTDAIERFAIEENTPAMWSQNTLNGNEITLISFNSNCIDKPNNPEYLTVNVKGEPHSFSFIENFLHELKHAVDCSYVKLDRDRSAGYSPLNEFDAVSFAGEARRQIEIYQGKEPSQERNPQVYTFESAIIQNPDLYISLSDESEIATSYRILKERGISVKTKDGEEEGADLLYQKNSEKRFIVTDPNGEKKIFRDMVREEKHNTTIAGESVKWVDTIQHNSNSRSVIDL